MLTDVTFIPRPNSKHDLPKSRSWLRAAGRALWFAGLAIAVISLSAGRLLAQGVTSGAATGALSANAKTDLAADPTVGSDWVRLHYGNDKQLLAMQTAIVRYAPAPGSRQVPAATTVDLVGAVHVGDAVYYDRLNKRFKQYDALLYELVAPEGTTVPRGRGASSTNPLGALQNGMKSLLELEHQLERVDYTKRNFVHADLTPNEFLQAMRDRDETFLEMFLELLGQSAAHQSKLAAEGESAEFELFAALFAPDRARRLKIALAKQLAQSENLLAGFGGEKGSVLITERNKRALQVLRRQIRAGKKKLAIFYGAGHLADVDQRLRNDFGLQPVEITWVTAWNLAPSR